MSTIETIEFTSEEGENNGHQVMIFALSTCGFCKACLRFLRENSVAFKYVYYDLLDPDTKDGVKKELTEKYKERIMFPFVIIDEENIVVGFKDDELKKKLNL
ncbi:MAG TPA: glutaredoxin family protein [Candidatus Lokiarchaeia archaeon]|nr:glutaredoxin family protein [Candidatus Lokiarchaeia archaeon]